MFGQHKASSGVFLYGLGLVIVASQPTRFWFGMTLACIPILLDMATKLTTTERRRPF